MCSQPRIQVLTLDTDTRACADVYNDSSPLLLLILDGAYCSRLWWRRKAEKYCFIFSHFLILHVPTWNALPFFFSSPNSLFYTSVCIFFFSVNCFQSTSSTLCYEAPLLPATKVANVNDRCYSDIISGVWGLFLPIRSVKSFFFSFQCLSCHH